MDKSKEAKNSKSSKNGKSPDFCCFFELGREREIALAEILAVLKREQVMYSFVDLVGPALVLTLPEARGVEALINKLGGTVKIGEIKRTLKIRRDLSQVLAEKLTGNEIIQNFLAKSRKIIFGLSFYFDSALGHPEQRKAMQWSKRFGLALKKEMKQETGRPVRFVALRGDPSLSSVVVDKNRLIEKGAEIDIVAKPGQIYLGRTLAVQPFSEFRRRDINRPVRSMQVGMIPPKLARVLLNLSRTRAGGTIYDPFAGLGTILSEAHVMGFEYYGSDHDPAMVGATQKNLRWLNPRLIKQKIFLASAQNSSRFLKPGLIDAIVSEGDLGPIFRQPPKKDQIEQNWRELTNLYKSAFGEWLKILSPGNRVVMTFPFYLTGRGQPILAPFIDKITALGYTLSEPLKPEIARQYKLGLSERSTLLYRRPGQPLGREIVIFKKV